MLICYQNKNITIWYIFSKIQSSTITTQSNTTWYHIQYTTLIAMFMGPTWGRQVPGGPHVGPMNFVVWVVTEAELKSEFLFTTDLALTGELWGVYCEEFGENWLCYNGTSLYSQCIHMTCITSQHMLDPQNGGFTLVQASWINIMATDAMDKLFADDTHVFIKSKYQQTETFL